MTDNKKRVLRNTIRGAIVGAMGGGLSFFLAENFDWGGWLLNVLTGAIWIGLVCLTMTWTGIKTRKLNRWPRRVIIMLVGAIGIVVFFWLAYILSNLIIGFTLWRRYL